jgi:simple sugar transport system permease protein
MINLRSGKFSQYRYEIAIVFVAVLVFLIFIIGNPQVFTRFDIYYSFMSTIPFVGILALSLTFVVILGEMDLSFPSVLAFASWVFGTVFTATGSIFVGGLAALATGIVAGYLNSLLIVRIGVPSLVGTIGAMFFWRGMVNVAAQGKGISFVDARGTLFYNALVGRLGDTVPAQMIWMIGLAVFFWFILNRHVFGSHLLFVGDNPASSKMMGINVNRVKTIAFVQVGFFAALVGIISTLEVTYFWPSQGQGYMLPALAAVFVGGTSVFGGKGTILGTLLGAIIIGSLEAGIISLGLSGFYIQLIFGVFIIASVSIYTILLRKRG